MAWYEILNGIRQTLRMAAVKDVVLDGDAEIEVITPVIRLAGTEAENGLVTCTLTTSDGAGVVAAGYRSISIGNVGAFPATVAGGELPAGASVHWEAPVGASCAALSYDASGTSILIAEVR